MASAVEICNLALLRVGQSQRISSLADASAAAQACNTVFELSRDAVLESCWWGFATRRATLALLADAERDGWDFVYVLPSGCLTVRSLWSGMRAPAADQRLPHAIEDDETNGTSVLLTDVEEASLIYTARITNAARFSGLFCSALAWKIAAELALGMLKKPQVGLAMEQKYEAALRMAMAADGNQNQDDQPPESEFTRERG